MSFRRKKRVSEPAPRDMICFSVSGSVSRKEVTRLSMAVVLTKVPRLIIGYRLGIWPCMKARA